MPPQQPDEPPPEARDLVATALGRALDEISATQRPVVPASLHRTAAGDELRRYRAATLGASLERARATLAGPTDEAMWVLVWDGYITIDDRRTDALYAHLEIAGEDTAHLFAWRYGLDPAAGITPLEAVMYLGPDGRYDQPGRSHPLPTDDPRVRGSSRRRFRRGRG